MYLIRHAKTRIEQLLVTNNSTTMDIAIVNRNGKAKGSIDLIAATSWRNWDTWKMKQQELIKQVKEKLESNITDIENRTDLTREQKTSQIIHTFCAVCAGIAIQPIPFADIIILTPIQAYMGMRLAAIHDVPVTEAKAKDIVGDIFKVAGLGLVAQQLAIGAYKTGLPGLGGFMTIPLVYGLTYAIGNVLNLMFEARAKGTEMNKDQLRKLFRESMKKGKEEGKAHREELKSQSNKVSDDD